MSALGIIRIFLSLKTYADGLANSFLCSLDPSGFKSSETKCWNCKNSNNHTRSISHNDHYI